MPANSNHDHLLMVIMSKNFEAVDMGPPVGDMLTEGDMLTILSFSSSIASLSSVLVTISGLPLHAFSLNNHFH